MASPSSYVLSHLCTFKSALQQGSSEPQNNDELYSDSELCGLCSFWLLVVASIVDYARYVRMYLLHQNGMGGQVANSLRCPYCW